ncbi:MAG: archaetidylserine decarboxylase [Hyphomicrobiaceae bacterium]|nr:archaetidylserine decarboxylase [Hyphomicrobiaceae bacterium]
MTVRDVLSRLAGHDALNFALTNYIPRRQATRFVGWLSKRETPLVRDVSIGLWRLFTDIDLSDAKTRDFKSLHDCFTRELKDGARPVDPTPGVATSPCDGIVVGCGAIEGTRLLQVKGSAYTLEELLGVPERPEAFRDGTYVTLRLTSAMYHRFHAPLAGAVERVHYIPGDVWNVNPAALARVDRLYCRNERAVIDLRLDDGTPLTLVPVAAVLVAGLKLRFLDFSRTDAPRTYPVSARLAKGEEMGMFEHGSTIIVLAPKGWRLAAGVAHGAMLRMGRPLLLAP